MSPPRSNHVGSISLSLGRERASTGCSLPCVSKHSCREEMRTFTVRWVSTAGTEKAQWSASIEARFGIMGTGSSLSGVRSLQEVTGNLGAACANIPGRVLQGSSVVLATLEMRVLGYLHGSRFIITQALGLRGSV